MALRNENQCANAARFYPDIINPETIRAVPTDIIEHVAGCPYCLKRLNELHKSNVTLVRPDLFEGHCGWQVREQIYEHFELMNFRVDCCSIRKFLPLLADTKLKITIPTPVTVHLDQCEKCHGDLSRLSLLNLNSENLAELSKVYLKGSLKNLINISELLCLNPDKSGLDDISSDKYTLCENIDNDSLFRYCVVSDKVRNGYEQILASHIRRCPSCLKRLLYLHSTIFNIMNRVNSGVTTYCELAPIGDVSKTVDNTINCETVRKFLPELAGNPQALLIPGPVAKHLRQCNGCKDDLAEIFSLKLNSGQLTRLHRIFASKHKKIEADCSKARSFIRSFVAMDFDKISKKVLIHLSVCPECRQEVYLQRQKLISELAGEKNLDKSFPCEELKPADIFNYCFPYGKNPNNRRLRHFDHSLFIKHVIACPECLSKMQKLHRSIAAIAERSDSGVFTADNSPAPAEIPGFEPVTEIYQNWPVKAWVRREQQEIFSVPFASKVEGKLVKMPLALRFKQKLASKKLHTYAVPAAAVAALVAIISTFFLFNTSGVVATDVDLAQAYRTVGKVKNVCIKKFSQNAQEPIQTTWVSQNLGLIISENANQVTYYDVENETLKIKDLKTGIVQISPLEPERITAVRESIFPKGPLVPFPFSDTANLPPGARWIPVSDQEINNPVAGTDVYDLIFSVVNRSGEIKEKWRYFVDPVTLLPKRTEYYIKSSFEKSFMGGSFWSEFEYPTDNEIKALLKTHFE